ncbi:hypothetical protein ACFY8P_30620 [Streptomyces sp. NPDC012693]|uniref:hypothetical protein n=1 Tax=Streptomyces sp. NPDC012693 TaxID=3364844 RepID=UPI00368B34C9
MRRHFRSGLALAGATMLLSACGDGGGQGVDGALGDVPLKDSKGVADVKTAPLAQPGTVSVMFCTDRPDVEGRTVYGVTLRSFSAKDGKLVAERSTVTPSRFEPATGCPGDGPEVPTSLAFDKGLTMMAGLSKGSRAAVVDTSTGAEIAPPDPDAFDKDLETEQVVFHPVTNQLWYNSDVNGSGYKAPQYFRDPRAAAATAQLVPYEQLGEHVAKDRATAAAVLAADGYDSPVSPSGVVATTNAEGLGLARADRGAEGFLKEIESAALRKGNNDKPEHCDPAFWRDDTTLVCLHDSLTQVTFSPDYQRVTKTVELLPESDRATTDPTLSPDGKSLVFLSKNAGDQWVLYRADFASPGAQPVKIAALDLPIDGADDHRVSLIRWS